MKKNLIKTLLLFLSVNGSIFSQIKKIILVDNIENEKVNCVKILDEKGNINSVSDATGIIEVDVKKMLGDKNRQIEASSFLFETQYFDLLKLPDTIKLKRKINILEDVVVSKRKKNDKYFKITAYFRSWRLINNKLQNYSEGLKDVYLPYNKSDKVKEYYTQYITFNDSLLKKKKTYINFGGDGYLFIDIYPEDYYTRYKHLYKLSKNSYNNYDLQEEDVKVGFVKYDENNQIYEINKKDVVADIKLLGKTINYRDYIFEKWSNNTNRHLSFSRNTIKKEIKNKNERTITETITEIYINEDKDEFDDETKTLKYKGYVDKNKSFYNTKFY